MPPDERFHSGHVRGLAGLCWPGRAPERTGRGPLNPPPTSLAGVLRELRRLRAEVAAAAGRVDELGALGPRVDRFTELHTELAFVVSEGLVPEVAALREFTSVEVARLQEQFEQVLTTLKKERHPPVTWPALSAEEAEEQWPVLAQWVGEVLVPWYELTREELPDCWPLHRPAVVELSWLCSAHVQAYLPPSPPSVAGEWHQRVAARGGVAAGAGDRPPAVPAGGAPAAARAVDVGPPSSGAAAARAAAGAPGPAAS